MKREHFTSSRLEKCENERLVKFAEDENALILSCSIVQLYLSPDVKQWTKQAAGIACVISYPSTKHNIICLLDIIPKMLWKCEMSADLHYSRVTDNFHIFSTPLSSCTSMCGGSSASSACPASTTDNKSILISYVGLNFSFADEAKHFQQTVLTTCRATVEHRQHLHAQDTAASRRHSMIGMSGEFNAKLKLICTEASLKGPAFTTAGPVATGAAAAAAAGNTRSKKAEKKLVSKTSIGNPTSFVHLGHVGLGKDNSTFDIKMHDNNEEFISEFKAMITDVLASRRIKANKNSIKYTDQFIKKNGGYQQYFIEYQKQKQQQEEQQTVTTTTTTKTLTTSTTLPIITITSDSSQNTATSSGISKFPMPSRPPPPAPLPLLQAPAGTSSSKSAKDTHTSIAAHHKYMESTSLQVVSPQCGDVLGSSSLAFISPIEHDTSEATQNTLGSSEHKPIASANIAKRTSLCLPHPPPPPPPPPPAHVLKVQQEQQEQQKSPTNGEIDTAFALSPDLTFVSNVSNMSTSTDIADNRSALMKSIEGFSTSGLRPVAAMAGGSANTSRSSIGNNNNNNTNNSNSDNNNNNISSVSYYSYTSNSCANGHNNYNNNKNDIFSQLFKALDTMRPFLNASSSESSDCDEKRDDNDADFS